MDLTRIKQLAGINEASGLDSLLPDDDADNPRLKTGAGQYAKSKNIPGVPNTSDVIKNSQGVPLAVGQRGYFESMPDEEWIIVGIGVPGRYTAITVRNSSDGRSVVTGSKSFIPVENKEKASVVTPEDNELAQFLTKWADEGTQASWFGYDRTESEYRAATIGTVIGLLKSSGINAAVDFLKTNRYRDSIIDDLLYAADDKPIAGIIQKLRSDSINESAGKKGLQLATDLEKIASTVYDISLQTVLHRIAGLLRSSGFSAARKFCEQPDVEELLSDWESDLTDDLHTFGHKETFAELFLTDYGRISQPTPAEVKFADTLEQIAKDTEFTDVINDLNADKYDRDDAEETQKYLITISNMIRTQGFYQANMYARAHEMSENWDEFVDYKLRKAGFKNGWWANMQQRNPAGTVIENTKISESKNMNLQRMQQLAGVKLTESVQAVPGIGSDEADMQTAGTVGRDDAYSAFDAAQTPATESAIDFNNMDSWDMKDLVAAFRSGQISNAEYEALLDKAINGAEDPYDYTDATMRRGEMGNYSRDLDPDIDESAPPGMEDTVMKLKKEYPGEEEKAFATAWSIYNKKHGKAEECVMDEGRFDTVDGQWTLQELIAAFKNGEIDKYEYNHALDNIMFPKNTPAPQPTDGEVAEDVFNNGYDSDEYASGVDFFPNGADSPVVRNVGPSGARQGDNPEQKRMQVAEVHKELVYGYRNFLKESAAKKVR